MTERQPWSKMVEAVASEGRCPLGGQDPSLGRRLGPARRGFRPTSGAVWKCVPITCDQSRRHVDMRIRHQRPRCPAAGRTPSTRDQESAATGPAGRARRRAPTIPARSGRLADVADHEVRWRSRRGLPFSSRSSARCGTPSTLPAFVGRFTKVVVGTLFCPALWTVGCAVKLSTSRQIELLIMGQRWVWCGETPFDRERECIARAVPGSGLGHVGRDHGCVQFERGHDADLDRTIGALGILRRDHRAPVFVAGGADAERGGSVYVHLGGC